MNIPPPTTVLIVILVALMILTAIVEQSGPVEDLDLFWHPKTGRGS